MDERTKKALSRLQRLCSRQECCRKDIHAKALRLLEGDGEAADAVVDSLLVDGYVDDMRYATAFAREKARLTGWGQVKVRLALAAKGIGGEDVAAALSQVEPSEAGRKLESLVRQKAKLLEGDPQIRLKLLRFSLSRGYEYDAVKPVVDEVLAGLRDG